MVPSPVRVAIGLKVPTMKSFSSSARQHVEEHHPDMERSDEQLRARVAADAYDLASAE